MNIFTLAYIPESECAFEQMMPRVRHLGQVLKEDMCAATQKAKKMAVKGKNFMCEKMGQLKETLVHLHTYTKEKLAEYHNKGHISVDEFKNKMKKTKEEAFNVEREKQKKMEEGEKVQEESASKEAL